MYICIYDILAIFDESWKKEERRKKKEEEDRKVLLKLLLTRAKNHADLVTLYLVFG